jgi:hypothetical protein
MIEVNVKRDPPSQDVYMIIKLSDDQTLTIKINVAQSRKLERDLNIINQ